MTSKTCASDPAAGGAGGPHIRRGSPAHHRPTRPESEYTVNAKPLADARTAMTLAAGSPGWRVKELSAMARATSGGPGLCCE
jgi:hypothetical protein